MQILDYGGPEQLALNEVPDPAPGPGDVVVDIAAASLNPIDWKMRAGHIRRITSYNVCYTKLLRVVNVRSKTMGIVVDTVADVMGIPEESIQDTPECPLRCLV